MIEYSHYLFSQSLYVRMYLQAVGQPRRVGHFSEYPELMNDGNQGGVDTAGGAGVQASTTSVAGLTYSDHPAWAVQQFLSGAYALRSGFESAPSDFICQHTNTHTRTRVPALVWRC